MRCGWLFSLPGQSSPLSNWGCDAQPRYNVLGAEGAEQTTPADGRGNLAAATRRARLGPATIHCYGLFRKECAGMRSG